RVLSPPVPRQYIAVGGAEAAAGKTRLSVKTLAHVADCRDFNHSAQLASVLGRKACGQDADRIDIIGFNFRGDCRGAVVRQGNAIDYILRLIFGAARMKNAVGLQQPSRLGIDQVNDRAAGRCQAGMVQGIRADAVYSPNAVRIDQRFPIYFYRCLLGFYRKSCFKTGWDSRPNLNRIGISDKPSALYLDPVQSKRKILGLYVSGSI